jgi:hypothetical protein
MSNARPPRSHGAWERVTAQQPTVAIMQPVTVPSTLTAGAGTGTAPNFVGIGFGVGAPTYRAPNGSLYSRFDGTHGATTVLYINTSGANTIGTTWTAIA